MKRILGLEYDPREDIIKMSFPHEGVLGFRIDKKGSGFVSTVDMQRFLRIAGKKLCREISYMRGVKTAKPFREYTPDEEGEIE